jgi:phosphohistidine phosphatase
VLIYLLRHGIAEDGSATVPDHERALTDEGWKRLRKAAPTWQRLIPAPALVFVSPLRRARETAEVFTEAVGFRGDVQIEAGLVPNAAASVARSLLEAEALSGTGAVAMVGHEPHLGYLLGVLLTGHPRLAVPLKKGMLVAVETESSTSSIGVMRWVLGQKIAAELA